MEATHFCRDLGLQRVIFEGDSSQIVNAILAKEALDRAVAVVCLKRVLSLFSVSV